MLLSWLILIPILALIRLPGGVEECPHVCPPPPLDVDDQNTWNHHVISDRATWGRCKAAPTDLMGWNTAEADPTLDTATTHRPKLNFSAWHSQWRFYPDGYSFLSHSLSVLVIWGQYFGISHLWSIAVQLLVQVAYICAWAHFSQTVTAETRPCLMIILTILVLEPDDGRETHGSAEQAGILLLLVPVLGPGAGGAVHPGHGTKYLKQWMILLNMLTTTNYSHAIILNLSHHRFTGFYQQNVKCSNVHFYNKTRMHHSGECTEYWG